MAVNRRVLPRSTAREGVTVERLNSLMRDRFPKLGRVPVVDTSAADFPIDPTADLDAAAVVVARLDQAPPERAT